MIEDKYFVSVQDYTGEEYTLDNGEETDKILSPGLFACITSFAIKTSSIELGFISSPLMTIHPEKKNPYTSK